MTYDSPFDGFTPTVFQEETGEWTAYLAELTTVSAGDDTPEKAVYELEKAWALMKECYVEDGEPIPRAPGRKEYSGQFNVRIDQRIHRALAMEAAQAGISLNALVSHKLADAAHR